MDQPQRGLPVTGTDVHRLSNLFLERTQDLLVLGLGLALFALMFRTLPGLSAEVIAPTVNYHAIIAEVLFILVMVELVRLLILYLREHRVAVDFMVELGIVSTLREVVLRGVIELQALQLTAIALFLLVLGALLRFGDLRLLERELEGPPTRTANAAASPAVNPPANEPANRMGSTGAS